LYSCYTFFAIFVILPLLIFKSKIMSLVKVIQSLVSAASCKKKLAYGLAALAVTAALLNSLSPKRAGKTTSLWKILDFYGFDRLEQKQALQLLMQKAKIIKPTESFNALFPVRNNDSLLFSDLIIFLSLLQKHFIIRKGTQERWAMQNVPWMEENPQEILAALMKLDIMEEIAPTFVKPDALCVLGARKNYMAVRLAYADKLLNNGILQQENSHLILLTGQRKAIIGVDGTKDELVYISKKQNVKSIADLTETDLIKELYSHCSMAAKSVIPTLIDTPANGSSRPTTETTVEKLCAWLRRHSNVKQIVFISNQPHIKYQAAIIKKVFKQEKIRVAFEISGPKIPPAVNIQEMISALGSQILAQTSEVITAASLEPRNKHLIKQLKAIYP
jgi:hypothetical protein